MIARKTNRERPTENMTCRRMTGEKLWEKLTVEKEGWTMGQKRREVDATERKMKGRKEVRVDVTKCKSITAMMTGRKVTGKKATTEKATGEKSATREMQNGEAALRQ